MKGRSGGLRILLITLVVLILGFSWLLSYAYETPSGGKELDLTSVYEAAEARRISEATLLDQDAIVSLKRCDQPTTGGRCPSAPKPFFASYPGSDVATQTLIDTISNSGGRVKIDKQTPKAISKLLVTFVFPLLMLANLFGIIFLSRSGDNSIADIVGFGKIGKKKGDDKRSGAPVTFANVGGADEAVAELREVTDYLKDPKKFEAYGAAAPKGVLLFGSPGCGKTLLARAVAGESGVPFFSISGAEFVESLVGVGAARVRDLFRQVASVAPAIVFIDEIDAVGRRREGEGVSGGEREQTVNQLLVEMDGFEVTAGIVVMGATNRPDILDPALLRPGRFDRHVTLEPPDIQGRETILELHARKKPLATDVDFTVLARRTSGFTGADLANVINESALLALREGDKAQISMHHLTEAVQRVLHGPQRRGRIMTAEEKKRLAFHESGHTLVATALGKQGEHPRMSIVARGRGLGQSIVADDGDRVLLTKSEMASELAIALAGIAAEELVFGESSTTAEDDIDRATQTAREMVGRYGMSAEIGRVRLLNKDSGYLGSDSVLDAVSGHTMQELDEEVKRMVGAAEQQAAEILARHRQTLDRLADALEEQETLEGRSLSTLLSGVQPEVFGSSVSSPGQPARPLPPRKPAGSLASSLRESNGHRT